MTSQQNQQAFLSTNGECNDDQPQAQLYRDEIAMAEHRQAQSQYSNIVNQTGDSVKTMAYGAADIVTGAARGAMGLAQGAAVGASNITQGAATAMKNTFGNAPENNNDLTTPLPTTNGQNPRI